LEAFETTAAKEGDGYVINGEKTLVVNGQVAQKVVVAAKMEEGMALFILERDQVTSVEPMYVLGMRSAGITKMRFENVKVGADAMLGEPGKALETWNKALALHSMGIAAVAVGIGQAGLDASVEYANTRVQFKQAIANFPAIQWMVADMGVDIEASRLLTHKTASLYDAGQDISNQASIAKFKAAETTMDTAIKCVQVHGGLGFTKESVAERFMRDAKVVQVLGVPSEVHKDRVAKRLLGL
jgi:alkylation response protein AidB-like acyl-CoA dehydrogenase